MPDCIKHGCTRRNHWNCLTDLERAVRSVLNVTAYELELIVAEYERLRAVKRTGEIVDPDAMLT